MVSSIADVISAINKISHLDLNSNDYDAVICRVMRQSNLVKHNGKHTHQSHIAITGDAMDLFPAIWIRNYQSNNGNSQVGVKSFYYLVLPVTLYKENIKYSQSNEIDLKDFKNEDTVTTYMSVKLSLRATESRQIELGNTTQSKPLFKKFRSIFQENDILIIAKEKQRLKYCAFIIRAADNSSDTFGNHFFYNSKGNSTEVNVNEFEDANAKYDGKNVIYYGAPGTGKSYEVNDVVANVYPNYEVAEGNDCVFRVSLYPEYSYSDFVGQYMPRNNKHEIEYQFIPGPFTQALKKAVEKPNKEVYLIVEEMSRANVATVFGDIFQLLDRKDGFSEYPINNGDIAKEVYGDSNHKIVIPDNMTIIGTVNTNDQNVFVMDTAFKRRFEWKYVPIDNGVKSDEFKNENNPVIDIGDGITKEWKDIYQTLNSFIVDKNELGLSEDKQIGPFFIKFEGVDSDKAHELVQDKLLQYLWEDINAAADVMDSSKEELFQNDISSFSMLYEKFGEKKKVFSDEFLKKLEEKEKKDNADKSAN